MACWGRLYLLHLTPGTYWDTRSCEVYLSSPSIFRTRTECMCSRETMELNSIFLWKPKVHSHAIASLECYPDPVNSGLSFSYCLPDLFQATQSPLPTLRRDTGQVIIFPSDISRNIYAYISYPVPLVHLGLITYILCSDQLIWQSSTLHTNLSRIPTYFLYLKSKTNISAAHCFRTILIHKISSVFLWKKSWQLKRIKLRG